MNHALSETFRTNYLRSNAKILDCCSFSGVIRDAITGPGDSSYVFSPDKGAISPSVKVKT